jgi:hypothetical protein
MDLNHFLSADETDEHNHCSTMLNFKQYVNFFQVDLTLELLLKNMQSSILTLFDQFQ